MIEDKVQAKDAYFIPAGHIHNIGEGLVIAEIQQSSDITYRIHDFNRTDKDGKTRDLHLTEAMEVLNFESTSTGKGAYERATNELVNLAQCEYFNINKIRFDQSIIRNLENVDSFIIYLCLEGKLDLLAEEHTVTLNKGDVYLVPACFNSLTLRPFEESLVLETYIP